MLSIALMTIATFALSGLVVVIAARRAPVGYQDPDGFSFGALPSVKRSMAVKRESSAIAESTARAVSLSRQQAREMTLVM